jgi:hypothetical protein
MPNPRPTLLLPLTRCRHAVQRRWTPKQGDGTEPDHQLTDTKAFMQCALL